MDSCFVEAVEQRQKVKDLHLARTLLLHAVFDQLRQHVLLERGLALRWVSQISRLCLALFTVFRVGHLLSVLNLLPSFILLFELLEQIALFFSHQHTQIWLSLSLLSRLRLFLSLLVNFEILEQHSDDVLDSKNSTKGFVLSHEAQPNEAVPLRKVDRGRWVLWLDAHDTRFDFRWRLEAILRHFDQVVNLGE